MSESESTPEDRPFAPRTYLATMPRWKFGMIGSAVAVMSVAAVMMFFEEPVPPSGEGAGALASTIVPGQDPATGAGGEPVEQVPWSESFFRFGFSFFVGFAIGYASRAFYKFLMFLVGGLAIFLFLMSYYEFITVEWKAMDQAFGEFGSALRGQFGAFRTFITGSLPNAGLAGLGLFTGFKKHT